MVKEEYNRNEETDYKNNIDDCIITRIPLDDSDLRQYYLDGSNSIMKNLPRHPMINKERIRRYIPRLYSPSYYYYSSFSLTRLCSRKLSVAKKPRRR